VRALLVSGAQMQIRLGDRKVGITSRAPAMLVKLMEMSRQAVFVFRRPIRAVACYVSRSLPPERTLRLRNGFSVSLSSCSEDIVTAMLAFCLREYGPVRQGWTVVDIGANFGGFSLYAAMMGAQKVYAFEPNKEAYECLVGNITQNHLESVIQASRMAVWDQDDALVSVPSSSSPRNRIDCLIRAQREEGVESVRTISVGSLIEANGIGEVDLLKLDCEGAEYPILLRASDAILGKIRRVRLEYHGTDLDGREGNIQDLISHLRRHGFQVNRHRRYVENTGILWFFRSERAHQ